MAEKDEPFWVTCASCGQQSRKHQILHEKVIEYTDEPNGATLRKEFHRFVECMGCGTTKYVISDLDCEQYDAQEENFSVYPDAPGKGTRRPAAISRDQATDDDGSMLIPAPVWKMYKETVDALNTGIKTLAAGGLRATVEAICLDKNITTGNLQTKIEELARQDLLTSTQAELLHEERYLGNAALHELATPSGQDIEDGLGIVEGLINTIYILPSKAKRLKARRAAKPKANKK
jgi:Domain of unknown function (DUF4145)